MGIYKNSKPFGNIVTEGLILNLDATNINSYSGKGTTWIDTAASNNGTLTNGPIFLRERKRGSIVTDGIDDYFLTSGIPILSNSNVTFCAFLKINNWGTGANPGLWRSDSNSLGGYFNIFNSNTGRPWIRWAGAEILQPLSGYQTPLNEWLYITFIVNSAVDASYYVNGDLKHSATHSTATAAFTIYNFNWQFSLPEGLGANYSNIHLYKKALTTVEIQQNYNALKGRFIN